MTSDALKRKRVDLEDECAHSDATVKHQNEIESEVEQIES
jgi:hypothetical protein